MRKMKLDVDDLRVTSFETHVEEKERGTVRGHVATEWNTCEGGTCNGQQTCWDSCDGVCGTYYCVTDGSCWNYSCINTCSLTVNPCYPTAGEVNSCKFACR
ncbi:pinensin family lanthipeptide [Longimicrobium sp.]|uniref:pinensin family lanthipeptide n=1 Tax=Longimicrobium sp. TaxID=2029185 RepID=UPI002BFD310C|nr:pinensin family lanthipeptide [Longimicrobium sp.]HSU17150.1 pinensin family lanthipeptide [Longimicrobium sp.]